jgi:hypothetical protein
VLLPLLRLDAVDALLVQQRGLLVLLLQLPDLLLPLLALPPPAVLVGQRQLRLRAGRWGGGRQRARPARGGR